MYKISEFPEIRGNYYLSGRDMGQSKMLRGKVAFITVFVKEKSEDWLPSEKEKYFSEMWKATYFLADEAKRYGTELEISNYKAEVVVPAGSNPRKGFELIKDRFGINSMKELQLKYEKKYEVDEAIIILAYDQKGRSFARKTTAYVGNTEEISVVFYDEKSGRRYDYELAHEILHQFGAFDYYFPREISIIAEGSLKNSIMGNGEMVVDDLTAYVVGWKDTISASSYCFLRATMWMDYEKHHKALCEEWKNT